MTAVGRAKEVESVAPSVDLTVEEHHKGQPREFEKSFYYALGTTAILLVSALFSAPALRDAATGSPLPGYALRHNALFTALEPYCDILDMLTLYSLPQHVAFAVSVFFAYGILRGVSGKSRWSTRWIRELGKCSVSIVILAMTYLMGLTPRPAAALHVSDPNLVTVDFHSHTMASHDGRRGFSAEKNRAWHAVTGFDVAYITDHRTYSGAVIGMSGNPPFAADGTILLPGIETIYKGQHLNILGADSITGSPYLNGQVETRDIEGISDHAMRRPLILITLPSVLSEVAVDHRDAPAAIDLIEIADASPRALAQTDASRSAILKLADSLDLAVVGGSDNHGWGWTAAAWSVMNLPGWRSDPPSVLATRIDRAVRVQKRAAVRVVERRRVAWSGMPGLLLIMPASIWGMFQTLDWSQRIAWLIWIWFAASLLAMLPKRLVW